MKKTIKKVGRGMLVAICIILSFFVITVGIFLISRIANNNAYKIDSDNGIQEDVYIEIGSSRQYMQIRGNDKGNPVVLWLHGGPGFPLTYMNYYYQSNLEKDYTIVCLEQRGCGRTYYENGNTANATFDVLISDVDEVVEYLKERFEKEKVIIMAQSWGTVIGMKYLEEHPENVSAYVGIGQVTQFAQGKIYSAEKAAQLANSQGKNADAEKLTTLVNEFEKIDNIEQVNIKALEEMIITSGKYLKAEGEMSGIKQMSTALTSPHINLDDAKWFLFASSTENIISSQTELMDYMYFGFDINEINLPPNVPLYFIQGECDYITPTDMVQIYYDSLNVENKRMVIIENAGHTPFLDSPDMFYDAIKYCLE